MMSALVVPNLDAYKDPGDKSYERSLYVHTSQQCAVTVDTRPRAELAEQAGGCLNSKLVLRGVHAWSDTQS